MATHPLTTRRALLKSVPALAVTAAAPKALAAEGESEIMRLFREWDAAGRAIDAADLSDDDLDAACDEWNAMANRMLQLPATTAAEVAAKVIAITGYGDFGFDEPARPVMEELASLVGSSIPARSAVLG